MAQVDAVTISLIRRQLDSLEATITQQRSADKAVVNYIKQAIAARRETNAEVESLRGLLAGLSQDFNARFPEGKDPFPVDDLEAKLDLLLAASTDQASPEG